jgi:hypothetical protein
MNLESLIYDTTNKLANTLEKMPLLWLATCRSWRLIHAEYCARVRRAWRCPFGCMDGTGAI